MANIRIKCPHCQATLEADPVLIGTEVTCVVCEKKFIVQAPANSTLANEQNFLKKNGASEMMLKGKNHILVVLVILSLLCSIISLFRSSSLPELKFQKDPEDALRSFLTYQHDMKSMNSYFWRKNGDEISKSLEIKETKVKGGCAAVFYKLSKGATEVKDVDFFYKSNDGYWIPIKDWSIIRNKFPGNTEMIEKAKEFMRDSGHFDDSDI